MSCVPEIDRDRDSARAPAPLFCRISCRSRSRKISKILFLTGAQDLLLEQDLLLKQDLLLEQEQENDLLICHVLLKLCQNGSLNDVN